MRRPVNLMPKDAEALEEFTSRVRSALGVGLVELKLFGSKATGRDEVESDIDVLVVVDGTRAELEDRVLDIAFDVNLAHDVYISPLMIDRSIFDHPVWRITPFLQTVTRETVPF